MAVAIKPLIEVDVAPVGKRPAVVKVSPLHPGARTDATDKAINNVMLLSMPGHEFSLLRPHLQYVHLPQHFLFHEPGEKVELAYFLNSGMTSLVVQTTSGKSCEVGILGREGMVSACLAVDICEAPYRAIMQVPGDGFRVTASALENVLANCPELKKELLRYVFLQGFQVAQIAACNRLHEIEPRLARWLLMCQDRVDSQVLFLTHEFLAEMLGTGRPSVTLAAGVLQRAGLIQNVRGAVRIMNRQGLEQAACECYRVVQDYNCGLGLK
jgi:CRP-like cAMP-binding protein